MKQNKKAKFWIRFLAKTIDVMLLGSVLIALLVPNVEKNNGELGFIKPWNFYMWSSVSIIYLIVYFYIFPICTNGYTLGNYLTRTKIRYKQNPWLEQAKREGMFSFIFVINILLLMTFINHTLINQIVKNKDDAFKGLTNWERVRVSSYVTITSIGVLIMLISGISIIVKKGEGIVDTLSNSQFVYINKFEQKTKSAKRIKQKYRPRLVEEYVVEWVE